MSRIGLKPIEIPEGVTVSLNGQHVTVKGPKGELSRELHQDIKVNVGDAEVTFERPSDHKRAPLFARNNQKCCKQYGRRCNKRL